MSQFLAGLIAMGYAVAALFFLRFWRQTRDRLFLLFALAFSILGIDEFLFLAVGEAKRARLVLYGVRLIAFCLILAGIVDKNRPRQPPGTPGR